MKIYFLRHGPADWPDWDRPDDERPLTKKGKKRVCRIAKFLRDLKVDPSLILSSPLPRAWQTAKIAAECLEVELRPEPALGKEFNATKLHRMRDHAAGHDLMIVGHEPTFSAVIRSLTGARVKLAKGGIARVDLSEKGTNGRLIWLIPPKAAR